MVERQERKVFLGARLRRLRRDLNVTQVRMAADLGLSPSYLNLLERNQRPVTAQVLLKLADAYELDLRSFSGEAEAEGAASLTEVFSDALFKDLRLQRHEMSALAETSPAIAEAITRLYQAYVDRRRLADLDALDLQGRGESSALTASAWVRDFVQSQRNYFADLDEQGEVINCEIGSDPHDVAAGARNRLLTGFAVKVQFAPAEIMGDLTRRYDHHRKRLFVSELTSASGRAFGIAYQLALLEAGPAITRIVDRAAPPDRAARALLRVSLANYCAAAILMPYEAFRDAAERTGYDLDLLKARFGVSYEQACHRLTTLSKPGHRGAPFFMIRVDSAGNISKRFAGGSFPFSRFGGGCPRWNLYACFRTPGRSLTQIIETPDGARYFTIARTVERASGAYTAEDADIAIGLGCELKYAPKLIYSRGLDLQAPKATRSVGLAVSVSGRPAFSGRPSQSAGL